MPNHRHLPWRSMINRKNSVPRLIKGRAQQTRLHPPTRMPTFSDNNNNLISHHDSKFDISTFDPAPRKSNPAEVCDPVWCEFDLASLELHQEAVPAAYRVDPMIWRSDAKLDDWSSSRKPNQQQQLGKLYPFNLSLEEELDRLFHNFQKSFSFNNDKRYDDDELNADFRANGYKDTEFLPLPSSYSDSLPEDMRSVGSVYTTTSAASATSTSSGMPSQPIRKKKKISKCVQLECAFCKNNNELPKFYQSHICKDENNITRCPVLRRYVCEECGAHGDNAHTRRYCPMKKPVIPKSLNTMCGILK